MHSHHAMHHAVRAALGSRHAGNGSQRLKTVFACGKPVIHRRSQLRQALYAPVFIMRLSPAAVLLYSQTVHAACCCPDRLLLSSTAWHSLLDGLGHIECVGNQLLGLPMHSLLLPRHLQQVTQQVQQALLDTTGSPQNERMHASELLSAYPKPLRCLL
jgi:hypothetical protein